MSVWTEQIVLNKLDFHKGLWVWRSHEQIYVFKRNKYHFRADIREKHLFARTLPQVSERGRSRK